MLKKSVNYRLSRKVPFLFSTACIAIAFVVTILGTTSPHAAPVSDQFYLGVNAGGISDCATEPMFKDLFKQAREWCPQRVGQTGGWGSGWPLAVDSLNWITMLDQNQTADAPLFTYGMDPNSDYVVMFDGAGTINVWNSASMTPASNGRLTFRPKPSQNEPCFLQLLSTTPANYVRNIRVVKASDEATYQQQPWKADYLQRWQNFPVIRFMDMMHTNNSTLVTWSQRTKPHSQTQALAPGVAYEYLVDYCNRTLTNPWICMPHMASDDFVRQFARFMRDNLDPRLKIYLEYSNECWNSMFAQTHYTDSMGTTQGLDPTGTHPWEAGWRYYGRRSKQMFKMWEQEFGSTDRFIRVIGSQMGTYIAEQKLNQDSVYLLTDMVAIAPYFGGKFDAPETQATVQGWTVNQLLDSCLVDMRGDIKNVIQAQVDMCNRYNTQFGTHLKLGAYEGGQHLVGAAGAENNSTLTNLFIAANRSPRMYDLYIEYLEMWKQLGGKVFCLYSAIGQPSKWGSWGILETVDQDPLTAPKYKAALEIIRRNPPPVISTAIAGSKAIKPSDNQLLSKGISNSADSRTYGLDGRLLSSFSNRKNTGIIIRKAVDGRYIRQFIDLR